MKKLIPLLLAVLLLTGLTAALAEDYTAYTDEELAGIRTAVDAELNARYQALRSEAEASFISADQFIWVDNGEEVMIRGYVGTEPDIVIPAEINGLPVTRIGESAFAENLTIYSAVLPDSVFEIGERAFYECDNLVKVILPMREMTIGENAFFGCRNLTSINLEQVSFIGSRAFMWTGLTGVITLRAEHLTIGDYAFQSDYDITGVKIYAKTCTIRGDHVFNGFTNLRWFYVSDDTQLSITGQFISDCPNLESFVAPLNTTISYRDDDLFESCPNVILYTPEGSGLHAYAQEQFIRCKPDLYGEMAALLDAAEQ